MKLNVWFDGSYGRGIASYGFFIKTEGGETLYSRSGRAGRGKSMSSAVAEYEGLYQAMAWIAENAPEAEVVFHGDSEFVIQQMKGESKAKKGKYLPYYQKTAALASHYIEKQQWSFCWIARGFNSEADALSQFRF